MVKNLFSAEFFNSLISSETSNRFSLTGFFDNLYNREQYLCRFLPHELCHNSVSVASPFSYETQDLNALCLIYTNNGVGNIFCENSSGKIAKYELVKDTIAVIDCRKYLKVVCPHNIWDFTICFVSTNVLEFFSDKILGLGNPVINVDRYPEIAGLWQMLIKNTDDDELHGIVRSNQLQGIFEQLYHISLSMADPNWRHFPAYILDIHKKFEQDYSKPYSLDDLANEYKVNKFKLCRDFSKYYSYTPMQFLTRVRIEKAKELLRATDVKIVDIGQMVGIDSTNHFIRLFKEKTGVTPLNYRKRTPDI